MATPEADHKPAVAVPYDPSLPIDLGGIDGVTPKQQAEAENPVAATLLGLPQWADAEVAESKGFRTIGPGGLGIEHLTNRTYNALGRVAGLTDKEGNCPPGLYGRGARAKTARVLGLRVVHSVDRGVVVEDRTSCE